MCIWYHLVYVFHSFNYRLNYFNELRFVRKVILNKKFKYKCCHNIGSNTISSLKILFKMILETKSLPVNKLRKSGKNGAQIINGAITLVQITFGL